MPNYWYIWYEVYENGELLPNSRGIYYQAYSHKHNAERRARKMWEEPYTHMITGNVYQYKWIISQTNPWEEKYEGE